MRLKLRPPRNDKYGDDDFRPTFDGLRHTSATMTQRLWRETLIFSAELDG